MDPAPIRDFVAYARTLDGDEKGEAQVFLDRLFQAFGHGGYKEAGATLEDRVRRRGRATGFADLVWPGRVLVEMKRRGAKLQRHYDQARDYWFNLYPKPRYVVLCNFDELWVYDFDVQPDPVDRVALDRLVERRAAFGFLLPEPEEPLFENNRVEVTREAAHQVAAVYNGLVDADEEPDRARRFVLQCVAAMFFEDAGLLPGEAFSRAVDDCLHGGADAYDLLGGLFRQMADPAPARGGRFAGVPYFNGGLFSEIEPVPLGKAGLLPLLEAARQDWRRVQPEVIGTLFQDIMDPDKRHASGAHFTHEADIQKIVQPTVVRPWRARIEAADTLAALKALRDELLRYRVLDPACGSGNFLYVAFRELKRLEIEVVGKAAARFTPEALRRAGFAKTSRVSVRQMYGLDTSAFAVELARVTLTIAKELAKREAAATADAEEADLTGVLFDDPLPLDDLRENVRQADALFAEWPAADAVVGNPPFVSKNNMAPELGAAYVDRVRRAYPEVPGRADYCVYWFRKAHDHLGPGQRAGLVGTNTVRQNYSREGGLDYVVQNGGTITEAVSSQPWTGDAAVHVSIANWVKGEAPGPKRLFYQRGDGPADEVEAYEVERIGPALSPEVDVTGAEDLAVNKAADACYQGQTHGHKGFLLTPGEAAALLADDPASADVLFPYMTGNDLLSTSPPRPTRYAIDLNAAEDVFEARAGGRAFEIVRERVMPDVVAKAEAEREKTGKERGPRQNHAQTWWRFWRGRSELLAALDKRPRYVACARVQKRPIFVFLSSEIRPNDKIQVFTLEDDYSFGIIQSALHWAWVTEKATTLASSAYNYNTAAIWYTFPWPQAPALAEAAAVAEAAVALRRLRQSLMQKHALSFRDLYRTLDEPGANPLRAAHARLDAAARAAYGFAPGAEPLGALLALNHAVAAREAAGEAVVGPGLPPAVADPAPFVTDDRIGPPPLPA
jgi:SAM-dependent methyltransferase